jgi:hypothetical protein
MLAMRAGRPVLAGSLSEGPWGKAAPSSAPKALQTYVWDLRRALGAACVVTTRGEYLLQVEPGSVDAARFERAVTDAAQRREAGDWSQRAVAIASSCQECGTPAAAIQGWQQETRASAGQTFCRVGGGTGWVQLPQVLLTDFL